MITGVVQANEARVWLDIRGPGGRKQKVEAVIDTGYTGSLTLPPALIITLGLRWRKSNRGILADGSVTILDVYDGMVIWDGQSRRILIDEADADPIGRNEVDEWV